MALEDSLFTGIAYALETEQAQRLTSRFAAQSEDSLSTGIAHALAIVVNDEGFDGNVSTRCEQMQMQRNRIVDRFIAIVAALSLMFFSLRPG